MSEIMLVDLNPVDGERIYILGAGAVGRALAAFLTAEGRDVLLVRASVENAVEEVREVLVNDGDREVMRVPIRTVSLDQLRSLDGLLVVTVKTYANVALAEALRQRGIGGRLVILQNGLGVEEAFLSLPFAAVYRAVLYVTGERQGADGVLFRPIAASPIGVVRGDRVGLAACVELLTTEGFPFRAEGDIAREVWGKTVINAVFNSICPLLEIDNGIFRRDEGVLALAREMVRECVVLAESLGVRLVEAELMERILKISRGSDGVLISTLQDLQQGRPTEMEHLNLRLASLAASGDPALPLGRTEALGLLVLAKARLLEKGRSVGG